MLINKEKLIEASIELKKQMSQAHEIAKQIHEFSREDRDLQRAIYDKEQFGKFLKMIDVNRESPFMIRLLFHEMVAHDLANQNVHEMLKQTLSNEHENQ